MIKSTLIGSLVLGLVATCATAVAQEPVPEGEPAPGAAAPAAATAPAAAPNGAATGSRGAIELGLRIGFGYPLGNEGAVAGSNNASLYDDVSGMIPLWIDP